MSILEKIKEHEFFSTRPIIDEGITNGVIIIGYKDSDSDIYSSIIVSPPSKSNVIKSSAMLGSRGCMIRTDMDKQTIMVSMSSYEEKDAFSETFSLGVDDGEFFQNSLINDYRHITYDHIELVRFALEQMNDE